MTLVTPSALSQQRKRHLLPGPQPQPLRCERKEPLARVAVWVHLTLVTCQKQQPLARESHQTLTRKSQQSVISRVIAHQLVARKGKQPLARESHQTLTGKSQQGIVSRVITDQIVTGREAVVHLAVASITVQIVLANQTATGADALHLIVVRVLIANQILKIRAGTIDVIVVIIVVPRAEAGAEAGAEAIAEAEAEVQARATVVHPRVVLVALYPRNLIARVAGRTAATIQMNPLMIAGVTHVVVDPILLAVVEDAGSQVLQQKNWLV